MHQNLHQAIEHHFTRHRIIIWYDDNGASRDLFDGFEAAGVQKVEICNNELALKHRVLKREPEARFLLYSPAARPPDEHNWLLDLVLSQFVFASDRIALYLNQLGLPETFRPVIEPHAAFFENQRDRLEPLQALISPAEETPESLRLKMIGVLAAGNAAERRSERNFSHILLALSLESFQPSTPCWDAIEKFSLADTFFSLATDYGYRSDNPSPQQFVLSLFERALALQTGQKRDAADRKAHVLLSGWENSLDLQPDYQRLVQHIQSELRLEARLKELPLETLLRIGIAPLVDWIICHRVSELLVAGSYDTGEMLKAIAQRRSGYWATRNGRQLSDIYTLLEHVLAIESAVPAAQWRHATALDLWSDYAAELYRIDWRYREALRLYQAAESPGFLAPLIEKAGGRYVNQFLQPLAERWDALRTQFGLASLQGVERQSAFFDRVVAPALAADRHLVVIVSDGLRFEIGAELAQTLRSVNRFETALDPMLASLPSFTQMGMNSLLPHETLQITLDGKVLVNGRNLASLEQRAAYLEREVSQRFPGKRARALAAAEFARLPKQAARDEIDGIDLLFLFHNRIDAVGDNAKTERAVVGAVADELSFLSDLTRRLANSLNRSSIVITADHGFLYQDPQVDDLHLLAPPGPASGGRVERRYMICEQSLQTEHVSEPELETVAAGTHVVFPDGLFRLRKQGGGVRYVHGGMSLQEICVPLIRVQRARSDDLRQVDVQILMSSSRVITTGTFAVSFFQDRPVDAKNSARLVQACFVAEDGTVISDVHRLTFDSAERADQNRGRVCQFHFTPDAARFNGQSVHLVLHDVRESGHLVPYARETYRYQTMGELDF